MGRYRATKLALAAIAAVLSACETTPTGRYQLQLFPEDQMAQMGTIAYERLKRKEHVAQSGPVVRYIDCVTHALTDVVQPLQNGDRWNVTVFQSDQVNAFALPGGNIGVYTGILKAARTPGQLAAVLGHEIAHFEADHVNARLSTQFATEQGLALIGALGVGDGLTSDAVMALLGVGAQVGVLLPFSRAQESEADVLGLRYMARAGFDPRAAIDLWQNMNQVAGEGPPVFLSDHPSGEQRINRLRDALPKAQALYRDSHRLTDCGSPPQ